MPGGGTDTVSRIVAQKLTEMARAPTGTPEPILAKLEDALKRMMAKPEIRARWDQMGLDVPPVGRQGFPEFIAKERALWVPVVETSGARVE